MEKNQRTTSAEFSRREMQLLQLAAGGATDAEIGERLGVSVPTLRTYWLRIRDKIGAVNRTHAIAMAVAGPLNDTSADPSRKLFEKARAENLAEWMWHPGTRQVTLGPAMKSLFQITTEESSLPIDRLVSAVWLPDRSRFEKFLMQTTEIGPLTPIDLQLPGAGELRKVVRTVNLTTHRSKRHGVVVLMASALSRSPGAVAARGTASLL